MPPQTIGLIAQNGEPGVAELVNAVANEFSRGSIQVKIEKETAALVGQRGDQTIPQVAAESDLLVVLGGDGTILNVADHLGDAIKPIFGINVGSLGFLTCSTSTDYREAVKCIAEGGITFSQRTLLDVRIKSGGTDRMSLMGLNDAVLSRGELSRLIRLRTRVNDEPLTEFNADGLI